MCRCSVDVGERRLEQFAWLLYGGAVQCLHAVCLYFSLPLSYFLFKRLIVGVFLDDDAQWFQQRSSHDADDGVPVPYLTEVPSAVLIGPFGVGGVVQGIDEPGWNVLRSEGAVSEGV